MDINYLIQLLGNRLNGLNLSKDQAFNSGDLERINSIDSEILSVQNTLSKLNLLITVEQTAASTPFTEAEVVQNGIDVSLQTTNQETVNNNNSVDVLLEYDISSYATDPLHEEKIADILKYIGEMNLPQNIDAYIDNEAIASPLTGAMIYSSAQKYNVDARLMMALMELDSRFGTVGIAIKTLNPGNIGNNDDGETREYSSWDEGVDAVAKWLDNHRVKIKEIPEEIKEQENVPEEVIETTVETDDEGNVITTTTTTTTEEVVIPKEESSLDINTETSTEVIKTETVSTVKQKRRRV